MKITDSRHSLIISAIMAVTAAFLIAAAGFSSFAEECEELPDTLIRLHILANSDSDEDQMLKYKLRDFIIQYTDDILSGGKSLNETEAILQSKLPEIIEKARGFMKEAGYDYDVKAELCEMFFTTRVYENITVPAGDYKALRIIIGEGNGQNWWCVIFPPLCLPACSDKNSDLFINEEMSKLIEQSSRTEYKFAIYEWLKKMTSK